MLITGNYYRVQFATKPVYTFAWGNTALDAIAQAKTEHNYMGTASARRAISCDWECIEPTIGGHYEQPKELPCIECKTLIGYDIAKEELGLCVECADEYYRN